MCVASVNLMEDKVECNYAAMIPAGEEHNGCREALVNEGAGVNIPDEDGLAPLMFAV